MANEKLLIDANLLIGATEFVRNHIVVGESEFLRGYVEAMKAVKETAEAIPTVSAVEVVHAKWENVQNGKGCCSNCHRLDSIDNLATHCRYCGAKMDGGTP